MDKPPTYLMLYPDGRYRRDWPRQVTLEYLKTTGAGLGRSYDGGNYELRLQALGRGWEMRGRSVVGRWTMDDGRLTLRGPWEQTLHVAADGSWLSAGEPARRVYRRAPGQGTAPDTPDGPATIVGTSADGDALGVGLGVVLR